MIFNPSKKPEFEAGKRLHQPFAAPPSDWVMRWATLLPPRARVLDVACGTGRHAHALARLGHRVTALDRDPIAMKQVADHWPDDAPPPEALITADIEQGAWPLDGVQFDALLITHYLWRPLWPTLQATLRPGGCYIHETFSVKHAQIGKPSRPDFLLQHGELLRVCQGWHIVAYEDGFLSAPDRWMQRIAAIAPISHATDTNVASPRHRL